jgi:squalene-hopene cyclase-like protein
MSRPMLLALVPRDAGRFARQRLHPRDAQPFDAGAALDRCVEWLCQSHEATGRRGSSKGYSLLHGWLPAYPETTGYVLGTLLQYGERSGGRSDLEERAREMGSWELEIQELDGGIMQGHVETTPRRSIVFNTGQVLHGWVDLLERGHSGYEAAAERAGDFLVRNLRSDGTWSPDVEYAGIPHTYNSRVAWAMVRWGLHTESEAMTDAAARQLDWVCEQQDADGWFRNCVFKTGGTPSTHGIAYTLRGLLESHALLGRESWLQATVRGSEALIQRLTAQPLLVANYERGWRPAATHACLTGTVQLGGVWLRLHQLTGEERFRQAGLGAIAQGVSYQQRSGPLSVRGALPGSFPIWGRYAPLQYPNWATKFLGDSLMLYQEAVAIPAA